MTKIQKYQRKSGLIEAVQIIPENFEQIEQFLGNGFEFQKGETVGDDDITIDVETNFGTITANKGDWLIKQPDGEIYPCEDAKFKQLYDEVIG